RRETPASSAAALNVAHDRMTGLLGVSPGSVVEEPGANVTEAPNVSLPVKSFRISAPAALNVLWPDAYSANGGVGNVDGWYGSHWLPSMLTVPWPGPPHDWIVWPSNRKRMAVIGRTESNARLSSQDAMTASMIALVSEK